MAQLGPVSSIWGCIQCLFLLNSKWNWLVWLSFCVFHCWKKFRGLKVLLWIFLLLTLRRCVFMVLVGLWQLLLDIWYFGPGTFHSMDKVLCLCSYTLGRLVFLLLLRFSYCGLKLFVWCFGYFYKILLHCADSISYEGGGVWGNVYQEV